MMAVMARAVLAALLLACTAAATTMDPVPQGGNAPGMSALDVRLKRLERIKRSPIPTLTWRTIFGARCARLRSPVKATRTSRHTWWRDTAISYFTTRP
jgi:hypothetical protein